MHHHHEQSLSTSSSSSLLRLRQCRRGVVDLCRAPSPLPSSSSFLEEDSNSSLHSTFTVIKSPVSSPTTKLQRHRPFEVENDTETTTSSTSPTTTTSQDKSSTTTTTTTTTASTSHRRVSFNEYVNVKETIHVNDFTDEEYQLYWMSHSEQDVILNMADITAELMTIGAVEDDEHICFRGLEGKTPEGNQEYSDMYLHLVEALIIEQEQCKTMMSHPQLQVVDVHEHIASLYREWTQSCKEIAWHRAQLDEQEVRQDLAQFRCR
jgi:hypothetical protein